MDDRRDERSLGQLVGDLTRQFGTLVRQEIELARTEMTSRVGAVGRDAALAGVGGALLYAGFLGLMAAAVLLLIEVGWSAWLSALVVALLVAVIGGALVARGRAGLANADHAPKRTVDTLKEDADWAKERVT
jgi:hypothetical protein